MMWRVKELADPHGVLNPGVVLNRDPERAPAQPQDASRRSRRSAAHVRRVRLLRAGLPEPQRDDHAAPADRAAPRAGPPARGLARATRRCCATTSTTRSQTCAADGTCMTVLPGRDRHRQADEELPRAASAPTREERVALAVARRWARGRARARAPACAPGALRRARARRPRRRARCPSSCAARVSAELVPTWPASDAAARAGAPARDDPRRARPPSTCPRASTGSSATRAARRRDPTLPEALVAVSAPRRAAAVDPGRRRAGTAAPRRGARRGTARATTTWRAARPTRCGAGRDGGDLPVVIDATSCAHGLVQDVAEHLDDERRARFDRIEVLDSIAWAHDHLLPAA